MSTPRPRAKATIYKGKDGLRWRVIAANGKKLGHGGQGYSRRVDLEDSMLEVAVAILRAIHVEAAQK